MGISLDFLKSITIGVLETACDADAMFCEVYGQ